jgi:PAS domain S-box-containing protein
MENTRKQLNFPRRTSASREARTRSPEPGLPLPAASRRKGGTRTEHGRTGCHPVGGLVSGRIFDFPLYIVPSLRYNELKRTRDAIPREDTLVRVVDGAGKCVGGVKQELLEYLRGTQLPERFMAILDKIDEAVIAIDREGRIYYVNPSYTKVLGVPVGRVLGRYLQRLEPSSALLTVLKPPHRPVSEKKQLIPSINKYVSIRVYPIFLHGRFQGAMSIFTDITRLNELNQEVERISQVAEEYSRQLEAETVLKQSQVIGESKVYTNSILKAVTVAKTDAAVLLRGENGVGKEVFTRILRDNSARKDKPFITVNCSAIPETLIESELFGYEEGASPGLSGAAVWANSVGPGGTSFWTKSAICPAMQAKLLRVLQEERSKSGPPEKYPR